MHEDVSVKHGEPTQLCASAARRQDRSLISKALVPTKTIGALDVTCEYLHRSRDTM
jgi:hypothetical protein